MLEKISSRQEFEDMVEMMQWSNLSQEGRNELCGNMQEENLEKCKVEEIQKGA